MATSFAPVASAPASRGAWPRSFVVLIVVGFALAAVPLAAAILISSWQLDRLAQQGQNAVYRSVLATENARLMLDQATGLERRARRFVVMGEQQRLSEYAELREDFLATVNFPLEGTAESDFAGDPRLAAIAALERSAYEVLRDPLSTPEARRGSLERLLEMVTRVRALLTEANATVRAEAGVLREMAAGAQQTLYWHAFAFVPLAVLLAAVFFVLISRPVRQLAAAIRRIGTGDLEQSVRIGGPRDLEELGVLLDWLRSRLHAAEAAKRRFLRQVSHELKTPLAAVRESTDLLADEVVGPLGPQQREVVGILRDHGLRLQGLIEELLAFSRWSERDPPPVALEPVDLTRLAERSLEDQSLAIRRKGIACDARLAPAVTATGDPARLRAMLDNLVSNAVKYTPPGGRIDVQLSVEGKNARIDVIDSGEGVAEGERGRVFEAFWQSEHQPPGPVRGTGIGLAIARECARFHDGDIELLPRALGEGAHFRARLPLRSTAT